MNLLEERLPFSTSKGKQDLHFRRNGPKQREGIEERRKERKGEERRREETVSADDRKRRKT